MKNHYTSLSLLIIACILFTSCQKKDIKPTSTSIVGYWYGSFLENNGASANQAILFENNNTIRVYDFFGATSQTDTSKATIGTGTYSVAGDSVKFNFTFAVTGPTEAFNAKGLINASVTPATLSYTFTDPLTTGRSGTGTGTKQGN